MVVGDSNLVKEFARGHRVDDTVSEGMGGWSKLDDSLFAARVVVGSGGGSEEGDSEDHCCKLFFKQI